MANLLKPTGSLVNNLYNASNSPSPEVGMGCTVLGWTDRHAATIVEISNNGNRLGIVYDKATRTDSNGMSECQDYEYTPGEGNPIYYSLRKNGKYIREGEGLRAAGLAIGFRRSYHDFSF